MIILSVILVIVVMFCWTIIKEELNNSKQGKETSRKGMRIAIIVSIISIIIIIICICNSNSSSSSSSSSNSQSWEKDANEAGYYKKNGKWYYQGNGAN